jgi:hypothetical protein
VQGLKLHIVLLTAAIGLAISVPLHSRAQQRSAPSLSAGEIVSRMEAARLLSKDTVPFLLQREYRMYHGDDALPMSQVKAEINVVPPHERDYKIVDARGSERGEKIVRKILEHEADAEKSSPPPTAIVHDNYDFRLAGEETLQGSRCYILDLMPKRQDPGLVNGRVWVDASTFLIRKVEGQMAKSPSWWVKGVRLTVLFGEVGGMWMQTSTHAVADVRLVGRYTVAGRATGVQPSSTVAAGNLTQKKARPRSPRVNVPAAVYNTGVLVSR